MVILGYLGAVLTGISLGLIGGGGSILIVPVLVYLFERDPSTATAYSLFVVGLASLIGAYKYAKAGLIDYKTGVIFSIPAFLGVYGARRFIVPNLPEDITSIGSLTITKPMLIMTVFATVMLLASISMIRRGSKRVPEQEAAVKTSYRYPWIALEGLGVGALTGFVGAGGGFLIIPALVLLAKLPMKLAVGTSLMIIAAKSLLGFLGDIQASQDIEWGFLGTISAAAILGILIGSYFSHRIPGKKLEPAFGWFVLIMGIYILGRQFLAI